MPASRCRSSTRWCSPSRRRASRTGTSSCRAITTPPASRSDTFDQAVQFSGQGEARRHRVDGDAGHPPVDVGRDLDVLPGLQHARPGGGRLRASGRASCGRRSRSPSTTRSTISIFRNGRGIAAQGPIPPGIFGYREGKEGINPFVYDWDGQGAGAQADRGGAEAARRGRLSERLDAKTGAAAGAQLRHHRRSVDAKSRLDWMRRQFEKIDVQLAIRATDYNRFQDKIRKGNVQLYRLGLARRLSRPRELPVPAARRAGQGEDAGRERVELRERRSSTACSSA